jgi:hypothetical protein
VFWIIPAAGAAFALIAVAVGAASVARANRALQSALARVRANAAIVDPEPLSRSVGRLNEDVAGARVLVDRAASAFAEIRAGLSTLRLREAMVALRLAGLAVRALIALR